MSAKLCGKCETDISTSSGYTKCSGCRYRYHYACSVSSTTWAAKSIEAKNSWRCDVCRSDRDKKVADKTESEKTEAEKLLEPMNGNNTNKNPQTAPTGESSDALLNFELSLKPLFEEYGKVTTSLITDAEKNLKSHVVAVNKNTENLIQALCSKIDEVFQRLKFVQSTQEKLLASQNQLLDENVKLKNDLSVAREKISSLELKMQSVSTKSYSNVLLDTAHAGNKNSQQSRSPTSIGGRGTHNISPKPAQHGNHTTASTATSKVPKQVQQSGISAGPVGSATVAPRGGVDVSTNGTLSVNATDKRGNHGVSDGWKTVGHRNKNSNRSVAKIGTKTVSQVAINGVTMVRPRPPRVQNTAALFISRFDPAVTTENIKEIISGSVALTYLKISRIRTKYVDYYASFHVEVHEQDFSKIDDVDVWPNGCLIKPYEGRLYPDKVLHVATTGVLPNGSSGVVTALSTDDSSNPK